MPAITPEILASLQSNTKNIRNICILAHVDHGKTTLSDRLISSNGIISNNLAGKIRYLDVRPDEIERRITMKSSCISLLHKDKKSSNPDDKTNHYLIHLIDSPGHVDFSSEVSTAVRLSDGGIVVVDVLEGVCVQTEAVLKQAWDEKLKVTLLLNKVDRLIAELQMTPIEAYERINRVLEQVNAVTGRLFSVDAYKEMEGKTEESNKDDTEEATEVDWDTVMKKEENVYFSPEKGNVCFGSALDGWGFSIETFVDIWVKKLGVKKEILQKTLWGEYYFNTKTKKIHTKNFNGKMVPMFVQFVLNSIWEVYSAAKTDKTKLEKIVNALQIKVNLHKFLNETPTSVANTILSKWLPIQDSVLQMVAESLPSPQEAQKTRIPKIWQPPVGSNDQMKSKLKELEAAMLSCDPNCPEVVIFVSKIFPLPRDSFTGKNSSVLKHKGNIMSSKTITVPKPRENANTESQVAMKAEETMEKPSTAPVAFRPKYEGEKFVAFARIFCGTLRKGAKVHVLGPRYIASEPTKHHSVAEIEDLYMLMGREVESIVEVSAGNIFGIGGLEDYIIKTATVTTTQDCATFSPMSILSSPIVRVAVEPENPTEKNKLVEGLKLLNQADPVVEIYIQETGEHVIVAAGELHLERCLRDLRESYARIKIQVSPPLVAFRETITDQPSLKFAKAVKEYIFTANKLGKIKVKSVPLPENIMKFLRANAPMIRRVFVEESVNLQENIDIDTFRTQLVQEFKNAGHKWEKEIDYLWSFGPRRIGIAFFIYYLWIGPNILLNHIPGFCQNSPWISASKKMMKDYQPQLTKARVSKKEEQKVVPSRHLDIYDEDAASEKSEENEGETGKLISSEDKVKKLLELENSIINGFQLATVSGPLCEEPMMGVCFMVEEVEIREKESEKADTTGPFNGQIMSATKEACRQAFLEKSARLMEPMYSCEIQIASDFMGKCYNVLGRRRAKILNEVVKEGGIFQIQSLLPVAESFGLSEEMLTQTSGSASVQLLFHNWELLDEDPFWIAHTEEELEDIGENVGGIAPNVARKYMDEVRKRKGLRIEEQIVKHADKQRTLKKNK